MCADVRGRDGRLVHCVVDEVGLIISEKSKVANMQSNTSLNYILHANLHVARDGYCTISDSPVSYLGRRKICREPEIAVIIPWRMLKKIKLLHVFSTSERQCCSITRE